MKPGSVWRSRRGCSRQAASWPGASTESAGVHHAACGAMQVAPYRHMERETHVRTSTGAECLGKWPKTHNPTACDLGVSVVGWLGQSIRSTLT